MSDKCKKLKVRIVEVTDENTPKTDVSEPLKELPKKAKEEAKKSRKSGKIIFKLAAYLTIFSITGMIFFSNRIFSSNQSSPSWFNNLPVIKQIRFMADSADRKLKGETNDRVNILLLGMGGKNHDGGYLADTIILASLEPSTKKVALISIPRDMTVPIENMGWRKINSVNAYAEKDNPGSGGVAMSQALSDILNTPIDYYARIDFDGFINIIDELGGIEVNVENNLDDYRYPVKGQEDNPNYDARYEHLHVEKGLQKMDGSLALKYARSRHAMGSEGSDFARARRQQLILEAVKEKALSGSNLFKPALIANIINQLQENFSTNLKVWEIIKLWDLFKDTKRENIVSKVLDNGPDGFLVNSVSEDGAYILTPRNGDFTEIQYFVNTVFSEAPKNDKTGVSQEKASIEVRNGTWINGLAQQTAVDLEKYGFIVIRIGNSSKQYFQKSVIYDLTFGEKAKSLEILKNKTGANVSFGLPEWLVEEIGGEVKNEKNPVQPDFILVLGQDADKTKSGADNKENSPE